MQTNVEMNLITLVPAAPNRVKRGHMGLILAGAMAVLLHDAAAVPIRADLGTPGPFAMPANCMIIDAADAGRSVSASFGAVHGQFATISTGTEDFESSVLRSGAKQKGRAPARPPKHPEHPKATKSIDLDSAGSGEGTSVPDSGGTLLLLSFAIGTLLVVKRGLGSPVVTPSTEVHFRRKLQE